MVLLDRVQSLQIDAVRANFPMSYFTRFSTMLIYMRVSPADPHRPPNMVGVYI